MEKIVKDIFHESAETLTSFIDDNAKLLVECAVVMKDALADGKKVLFFGNGGSAGDAQHLAGELVNRFLIKDRPALAGIALTTDTSVLTCIANDSNFDYVFSRQVEALGKRGDIAFGISTSGNSQNVINAFQSAKKLGMVTIALTGNSGGKMKELADYTINVYSTITPRIQEAHITIGHTLCQLIESYLYGNG